MTSPVQRTLKHYQLERQVGAGGMGTVYAATDRRDGSRVAVKLLHPHLAAVDAGFRERFEREAHVAALLRSPYTVHVLDFGVVDGEYFLAMEYVEGTPLDAMIRAGPLDPERAVVIATDVARALEEAQARGVVHRDIKPENVLIEPDGHVKVADFGIARQVAQVGMTATGGFVGTAAYAAPEQALGEADHRTDVYALGAVLYCMIAGRPPFQGTTVFDVLRQHRESPVPPAPLARLPDTVANLIRRCLEKDPRDRYQSASELVGALERGRRALQVASAATLDPATPPGSPPEAVRVPPAVATPEPDVAESEREAAAAGTPSTPRDLPAQPPPEAPTVVTSRRAGQEPSTDRPQTAVSEPEVGVSAPADPSGAVPPAASTPPPVTRTSVVVKSEREGGPSDAGGPSAVPLPPARPQPAPAVLRRGSAEAEPRVAAPATPTMPPAQAREATVRPTAGGVRRLHWRSRQALVALAGAGIIVVGGLVGTVFALSSGENRAGSTGPSATASTPADATPTATATATPTVTPTPTATPLPSVTPPVSTGSSLMSGARAEVANSPGCSAKLWKEPSEATTGNSLLRSLCDRAPVTVVTNTPPGSTYVVTEGWLWWRVLAEETGEVGWMKEGLAAGGGTRYLVLRPSVTPTPAR